MGVDVVHHQVIDPAGLQRLIATRHRDVLEDGFLVFTRLEARAIDSLGQRLALHVGQVCAGAVIGVDAQTNGAARAACIAQTGLPVELHAGQIAAVERHEAVGDDGFQIPIGADDGVGQCILVEHARAVETVEFRGVQPVSIACDADQTVLGGRRILAGGAVVAGAVAARIAIGGAAAGRRFGLAGVAVLRRLLVAAGLVPVTGPFRQVGVVQAMQVGGARVLGLQRAMQPVGRIAVVGRGRFGAGDQHAGCKVHQSGRRFADALHGPGKIIGELVLGRRIQNVGRFSGLLVEDEGGFRGDAGAVHRDGGSGDFLMRLVLARATATGQCQG